MRGDGSPPTAPNLPDAVQLEDCRPTYPGRPAPRRYVRLTGVERMRGAHYVLLSIDALGTLRAHLGNGDVTELVRAHGAARPRWTRTHWRLVRSVRADLWRTVSGAAPPTDRLTDLPTATAPSAAPEPLPR